MLYLNQLQRQLQVYFQKSTKRKLEKERFFSKRIELHLNVAMMGPHTANASPGYYKITQA